jgi:pseudouridine synthase
VTAVPGLVPVGRLDADSRGLLLLSTDGELVHRLTHPRHGVTKRYRLVVDREVAPDHLRRLVSGVHLEDGPARALAAHRGSTPAGNVVEVTMGEGRKREVRRLCAALGLHVTDLVRVAYGPVRLGRLQTARARPLTAAEERDLYACVGLVVP